MPKLRPAVHITTRLPAALVDKITAQAKRENRSRSNWVQVALTKAVMELAPEQLELPLE